MMVGVGVLLLRVVVRHGPRAQVAGRVHARRGVVVLRWQLTVHCPVMSVQGRLRLVGLVVVRRQALRARVAVHVVGSWIHVA